MGPANEQPRSDCAIGAALDVLGDRWTLLVIRDLAFAGKRSFSELRDSDEGIATNILAERLARLESTGIVLKARDPDDGRRFLYRLTDKGNDLIPILLELALWSTAHGDGLYAPPGVLEAARSDRDALVRELKSALA